MSDMAELYARVQTDKCGALRGNGHAHSFLPIWQNTYQYNTNTYIGNKCWTWCLMWNFRRMYVHVQIDKCQPCVKMAMHTVSCHSTVDKWSPLCFFCICCNCPSFLLTCTLQGELQTWRGQLLLPLLWLWCPNYAASQHHWQQDRLSLQPTDWSHFNVHLCVMSVVWKVSILANQGFLSIL